MRVQTEEWRRFIPGVRMYKGKKTLFYNGEKLYDVENNEYLMYNQDERKTWEVIIVLPDVEVIPERTFRFCKNVEAVIMSDTVKRIEAAAFLFCKSLVIVRLSRNLECIGEFAFVACEPLTSIFIPPSCREIEDRAFEHCKNLIILKVPLQTQLGDSVIAKTALIEASPFPTGIRNQINPDLEGTMADRFDATLAELAGLYDNNQVNEWLRNMHRDEQFSLHRACSSYNPLGEIVFDIVKRQGLKAFQRPDNVGVTASQYLSANPFTEMQEKMIIKRYILDMMGEVI
ncbi:hypothetical protein CTEN210_01106 [Chaetoceros tenuissimus]|uniref:Leucine-rich repeat domain-containing protein n=1 Tax=Chaetoceros tenuissimus TaxID=426638 RepID=A0AAD3CEH0_9STRA|nr:hypothetical protein CTEN210_01106 [Chaetoceros tenuissimus]